MKAYMGYSRSGGPGQGAVLIFANSAKEARIMCAKSCIGEIASGWVDVTVRWLKGSQYLFKLLSPGGKPCCIDNPPTCKSCLCWGNSEIGEDGLCDNCRDELMDMLFGTDNQNKLAIDDWVVDEDS